MPPLCKSHIDWAWNDETPLPKLEQTCGVNEKIGIQQADIARYFKCYNMHKDDCNDKGLDYPTRCTCPPCNRCFASCLRSNIFSKLSTI